MDANILSGKKVLMIAYGFPPIAHAGVYRTLRFCQYLPDNGWKPTVITIRESKDIHSDHSLLKRIPEDVRVHRTATIDMWRVIRQYRAREAQRTAEPEAQGNAGRTGGLPAAVRRAKGLFFSILLRLFSIPDHMLFWVPFAMIKGAMLMTKEKFDVIYTTSPPHSEHLTGLIISKIFRTPWVADLRDPIVGNFNTRDLSRLELKLHEWLEKLIVRAADTVIVVTRYHQKAMQERHPDQRSKFIVIRNGFDPALFENVQAAAFDKFTILFAGTLYGTITPDFFVRGLAKWLETKDRSVRKDVQALFFGMGTERAGTLARELGIGDVVKTSGLVPQTEIIQKLKGADLLLLIIGNDSRSAGVIASKLYEYMALNRPILAIIPQGETLEVLREYGNFHHAPHDDYGSLLSALDDAYGKYIRKDADLSGPEKAAPVGSMYDVTVQVKDLIHVFHSTSQAKSAEPGRQSVA